MTPLRKIIKMPTKSLFSRLTILALLAGRISGCTMSRDTIEDGDSDEASVMPELIALRQKANRLEKQNKTLATENSVLKDKVAGLSARARKLAQMCNKYRLEASRREAQVELLKNLPAERDNFKAEAEKQKRRADKLQEQLDNRQVGNRQ